MEADERKRKEELELEEKRRREEIERQKLEIESEEKKRKDFLEAEQMGLRKRELERQINRDRAEDESKDSAVVKDKLFGDAIRPSAICMGTDPIEAIPFFQNVEQLFAVYAVPESLQPVLIPRF